jgi:hypothetical protein
MWPTLPSANEPTAANSADSFANLTLVEGAGATADTFETSETGLAIRFFGLGTKAIKTGSRTTFATEIEPLLSEKSIKFTCMKSPGC